MNTTPTIEQAALAAANYATAEFPSLSSWYSYESELAKEWLKNPNFVCALEYAIKKTVEYMRHNSQMQGYAATRGGGARGVAAVVGNIVGEWTKGGTTIDRELDSW